MDEEGVSMEEFKWAFVKGNEFASGTGLFPVSLHIPFRGVGRL